MRIYKIPIEKLGIKKPDTNVGESQIDKWCMEHGLVRNKDYTCYYMSGTDEYHVRFNEEHTSMGSLLLLRWS